MFLPRQQHFLQRWLLQVRSEKRTFILILLSRQNCSQWKSILFYVPHLHFTFSADLTRKLMFCTKVARKDFTKTKLPSRALICPHVFVYVFSTHWGQYLVALVRTSGVGNVCPQPCDQRLGLSPDSPWHPQYDVPMWGLWCSTPLIHMQLPADQEPLNMSSYFQLHFFLLALWWDCSHS